MNDATLTPLNPTRQDRVRETGAIQTRIDAAAAKGGGRVIIPKGVHPCRTLYLRSGVELHLEEGAVILGGPKSEDYDDAIPEEMVYRYGDGIALRDFGHMAFRNFTVETERPFVVKGNEATPVRGMRFENIRGSVKSGKAFDVEHAPDIVFGSMDVTARS